ncbi:hypothetical protein N8I87_03935 [Streptomyces sp. HUAS TT20]|nr:VOC family protein [Streptomyces sp. HUAS 15-9]UXY25807.1 hypothetical protein N8I87_03935 [Streptomyces sp. HUAS 15-9]
MAMQGEQVAVDAADPAAPVGHGARLLSLGARRADVGQGEQPWTVLMDPEGNEFCVLSSRRH